MKICDLCKNNPAKENNQFRDAFGGKFFRVNVTAQNVGSASTELDLCEDCAAKGALAVLGVNPTEPKKETT